MTSKEHPSKIDWSQAQGLGYVLSDRSHLTTNRLTLQHYLWHTSLNFTLHPSIPLPPNPVIADIASGTALWLIDVSQQYPTAQLHGFDTDTSQSPHEFWLPKNISIHKWDIFDEVPNEFMGMFDIVHIRLVVLVLEDGDGNRGPVEFLKKIIKLLKPGGYIQWDELDCLNMSIKTPPTTPPPKTSALSALKEMSYANGRYNWVLRIPEFMNQVRFEESRMEHYGDPDWAVRAFNDQHLFTMELFGWKLIREGKREAGERFLELVKEGFGEGGEGVGWCIPRVVCLGRKSVRKGGD